MAVRTANIIAARAVSDSIRTSLGPRGMDKMIQTGKGETIVLKSSLYRMFLDSYASAQTNRTDSGTF
jgi:hypothetical protein